MRIGNRILSFRKVAEPHPGEIADEVYLQARERLRSDMQDARSEIRSLMAKVARSTAKDYFDEMRQKAVDPTHCLGRPHGCGCPEGLCRLTDKCSCPPGLCMTVMCKVCTVDESLCLGTREPE